MDVRKKAERDRDKRIKAANEILSNQELSSRDIARVCTLYEADYVAQAENQMEIKPLFDVAIKNYIQRLVRQNKAALHEYNTYMDPVDWAKRTYKLVQSMGQQAFSNYSLLTGFLKTSMAAYDTLRYRDKLPVIMTRDQYADTVADSLRKQLYIDGDKDRPRSESLLNLILRGMYHHTHKVRRAVTEADKHLVETLRMYAYTPIESPLLKKRYTAALKQGWWETPDGVRSDRVGSDAWEKATAPGLYEEKAYRKENHGTPSPEYQERIIENLRIRNAIILKGGTDEEAQEAVYRHGIEKGDFVEATFHRYSFEELPYQPVKRDILSEAHLIHLFYPALFSGDPERRDEALEELHDFYREFKDAIDLICDEIDRTCFDLVHFPEGIQQPLIPSVSSIPMEDWSSCFVYWKDLYDRNTYGLAEDLNQHAAIFSGNPRALRNGVAILEQPTIKPGNFTAGKWVVSFGGDLLLNDLVPGPDPWEEYERQTQYYRFPDSEKALRGETLKSLAPDDPDYSETSERLRTCRKLMVYSYLCIKTYNALIDLFIRYYKAPEMEALKASRTEKAVANSISVYNDYIANLYCILKGSKFEDPLNVLDSRTVGYSSDGPDKEYFVYKGITPETDEEKAAQEADLKALRDNFNPVDLELVQPDKERMAKVKQALKGNKAFSMSTEDGLDWITMTAFREMDEIEKEGF